MLNNIQFADSSYSLLAIIVNRGKGSKVLQFAGLHGASEATCLLGKGTIKNELLKLICMNDVEKEIILIIVPSDKEQEFLNNLNMKFHFDKPNHGIAFVIPLAGILKLNRDAVFKKTITTCKQSNTGYVGVFLIVNDDIVETVIRISQNAGYYGGTIIKASGSVKLHNIKFNMLAEPKKDAILLITESSRAQNLANLLSKELNLNDENNGMLVMLDISHTIGIYKNEDMGDTYE